MKRAAAYIRVSTEQQTTENQLPAIKAYASLAAGNLLKFMPRMNRHGTPDGNQNLNGASRTLTQPLRNDYMLGVRSGQP